MAGSGKRYGQLGWFDYVLSGTASCLAGFSAGFGVGVPEVAFFFVGWILVATFLGAMIQRIVPRKFAAVDGLFYALCAIVAIFYGRDLNSILPGEGFPEPLRIAGWLCWMLVFGSFFMWRDSTVLFQAVPGIAIFGLVGTWDTFRASPFLFFVFLLCFATLFARAHGRAMMLRARESGFNADPSGSTGGVGARRGNGQEEERVVYGREDLVALRKGPWKWMAGPEWALLSALFVVLISLIGAPFLQYSLQGVSGRISLPAPPTPAMKQSYFGTANLGSSTNFQTSTRVQVGSGPHGDLARIKIFELQFGASAYLKAHTCEVYNGHGWDVLGGFGSQSPENKEFLSLCTKVPKPYKQLDFSVSFLSGTFDSVPVPGAVQWINGVEQSSYRKDGTVANGESIFTGSGTSVSGQVALPESHPVSTPKHSALLEDYSDASGQLSTQRVRDLAASAVRGATSDYQKAEAIRALVASRCTYDLNASPVPEGQDSVDYFLFESKRGYCDLFASAMTVLARSVDLPARFVTGWAPFTEPQRSPEGWVTYYDTDYHCWSEIYFENTGWVIFDATDGAAEAPGGGRGSVRSNTPWYLQWSVGFGLIALALIGLVALALSLFKKLKLRVFVFGQKRAEMDRIYADLLRMMELRTGKPRRPSQTALEYFQAITPFLDGSTDAVRIATESFIAVYYGSAEPAPEAILDFKEKARLAKEALKLVKRPKEPLPEMPK